MIALVFLIITLLSVPVTMFQALEEQDTRQDAAITSIGTAEDPCAIPDEESPPPDDGRDSGDEESDTPSDDDSDDGDSDTPDDESSDDTDSPDDGEDTDTPEDNDDTPDEDSGDSPRSKTPRVRDPERTQRKLAREIRKRVNQKRPSITVTVPTPNIRKPNIPTPRPPRQPLIDIPTFDDLFGGNEKGEEDLGEQIQKKVKSRFESKGPAPTSVANRVRPTSPVTKRVRPTSPVAKQDKDTRRTVQAPRTQMPVVSQAIRAKKGDVKNTRQTVKERLKNNRVRVQQTVDCPTPTPSENQLENPVAINVTVKGVSGTLIPDADVWFNAGQDGSCKTNINGTCSEEIYHQGDVAISVSKEGYDTRNDKTIVVKDADINTTVTLYREGKTPKENTPTSTPTSTKKYTVIPSVYKEGTSERPTSGTSVTFSQNGATVASCMVEKGSCEVSVPKGTYFVTAIHPDYQLFSRSYEVTGSEERTLLRIDLKNGFSAKLYVRVTYINTNGARAAVSGATVNVKEETNDGCTTYADGRCTLTVHKTGTFTITMSKPDEFHSKQQTVTVTSTTKEQNVEISTTRISGPATSSSTNVLDYNSLLSCYSEKENPKSCSAEQKKKVDLNRDGKVNQLDYNMFISSLRL